MEINVSRLPTHLALVARRAGTIGKDASADTFLATSYLIEATVKTIAIVLVAALRRTLPEEAYRACHNLVRADGLGTWTDTISEMVSPAFANSIPRPFFPLVKWLSQKRTKAQDEWFRDAVCGAKAILRQIVQDDADVARLNKMTGLLSYCVTIRNKTKAHGACGPDFFYKANAPYRALARAILDHCPLCDWQFISVQRDRGTLHARRLLGLGPAQADELRIPPELRDEALLVQPNGGPPLRLGLFETNRELTQFYLPNGRWNDKDATSEFIDYASGKSTRRDCSELCRAPAPLPRSETHGAEALDVCSNAWGNLPEKRGWYVRRRKLEMALKERLFDHNHAIITLHGIGGIGKTSLALWAAHELALASEPRFEEILWFSARDLDLRQSGPSPVKPAVITLQDIAQCYGRLMETGREQGDFAQALRRAGGAGTLFIFDNFETIAQPRSLHEFLDTHTHLPNKVLITSRERAFKADYPIEVKGMDWPEAEVVILQTARRFNVEGLVGGKVTRRMFDHVEGHPYLMQILVGEVAAAGRYVPPPNVMGRRGEVLDAIFERSFEKLSDAGRWAFLLVSNWRAPVPEIWLYAIAVERDVRFEEGIDECRRWSLVSEMETADGQVCYECPQVARVFGKKKLLGDPDRLAVQADLDALRQFGVVDRLAKQTTLHDTLQRFFDTSLDRTRGMSNEELEKRDHVLANIAERWREGWRHLAEFRHRAGMGYKAVDQAARRAVEEMPNDVSVWKQRADYARQHDDEQTEVTCWVSIVELDPTNVVHVSQAANLLNKFVGHMPIDRRGFYIASVRDRMEQIASRLDATGRSRLAWLYLHEENYLMAQKHVNAGLKLDSDNSYCLKLYERLRSQGV